MFTTDCDDHSFFPVDKKPTRAPSAPESSFEILMPNDENPDASLKDVAHSSKRTEMLRERSVQGGIAVAPFVPTVADHGSVEEPLVATKTTPVARQNAIRVVEKQNGGETDPGILSHV